MLIRMKLDSILKLRLLSAIVVISLLNGCYISTDNLFEINRSSIASSSNNTLDQGENLRSDEPIIILNTDNSKSADVQAALIRPVAALDNFFDNLKVPSLFASRRQSLENKVESTSKELSELKSEINEIKSLLIELTNK